LIGLGSAESPEAAAWSRTSQEFFQDLDPRIPQFYLAARSSAQWNTELTNLIRTTLTRNSIYTASVEGITFTYTHDSAAARELLTEHSELEFIKHTFRPEGGVSAETSTRSTVIQTKVSFDSWDEDEFHDGKACVDTRFFLPSGSYATAALRQLFGLTELTDHATCS
jgi:tRNA pseudouridine13 synthase